MSENLAIIVKRVVEHPSSIISKKFEICECVDRRLKQPDPTCLQCGGTGRIEYSLTEELTSDENRRLVTLMEPIHFEGALTVWGDEEGEHIPLTDILAYFSKDEEIVEGDYVIYRGKRYQVVEITNVISPDSIKMKECSLERVSQ